MKILGIDFAWGKISHTKSMAEDKYRFLVVDTAEVRNYYGSMTTYACCKANEFETEEKAMSYIDEYIPKGHRNRIRIYKEIKFNSELLTNLTS